MLILRMVLYYRTYYGCFSCQCWVAWKERNYLFLCVALKDANMQNNEKGKRVVVSRFDSNIRRATHK